MSEPGATSPGPDTSKPDEPLEYNAHLEQLIAAEGEKALALEWLHDASEKRFTKFNTSIALPVIVLSTLSGTASIGQAALFGPNNPAAPIVIGLVSILVGILNTVSSYFSWAKRAEGHRIARITYSKLYRTIRIELSLPRPQRIDAGKFLKMLRELIDRLNETSPPLAAEIVAAFNKKFAPLPPDITIPEVCNGLHKVDIYPTMLEG